MMSANRNNFITRVAAQVLVVVVLLNLFVSFFSVVRYYGDGMEPTLKNGQILLIKKTDQVTQGDVIAFYYNNKILVRRVICDGGEQLSIDKAGTVTVNGESLNEAYVALPSRGQCNLDFPYHVSEGQLFVMGDNRLVSMDSRLKEIGTVPQDRVVGKVMFVD